MSDLPPCAQIDEPCEAYKRLFSDACDYAAEIERLREALEKLDIMISDWAKDEGIPHENSACWCLVRATLNPNS